LKPLHRTWLEIDGAALRRNLAALRRQAGPGPRLIGSVKANAYGHGLLPVARELRAAGIEALAVSDLDELAALRAARIDGPVLVLGAALPGEFPEIVRLGGWPSLSTYAEARALDAAARQLGQVAEAHFKVDTGMGRLGLPPAAAIAELQRTLRLRHVRIGALFSHFARADDDAAFTARQLAAFHAARAWFAQLPWHFANSAGIFGARGAVAGSAWARPGLALYGLPPRPADRKKLSPVLAWKARIVLLRDAEKGETVSYGATYRLPRAQRLATLAVGYGDGYPRALSNRADVLVGGRRCPIRGRVTMDQIVIDVSRVPAAKIGQEAVLLGPQGKEEITADELARHAGTISYEIVTRIAESPLRLPRVYRGFRTAP